MEDIMELKANDRERRYLRRLGFDVMPYENCNVRFAMRLFPLMRIEIWYCAYDDRNGRGRWYGIIEVGDGCNDERFCCDYVSTAKDAYASVLSCIEEKAGLVLQKVGNLREAMADAQDS